MAKRRTKGQIEADKIIRKRLMELGEKIYVQTVDTTRVAVDTFYKTDRVKPKGTIRRAGGELRDSPNFRMLNDTSLLCVHTFYGAFNYPKGNNTKRTYSGGKIVITKEMNALLIAVNENIENAVDLMAQEITSELVSVWQP